MFKAAIFDLDGTLISTEGMLGPFMQGLFGEVGIVVTPEEHKKLVGRPIHVNWADLKRKHGLKQTVDDLVEFTKERFIKRVGDMSEVHLMPGVEDLLEAFRKADYQLGVSTSAPRELLQKFLREFEIDKYFRGTSAAEDVENGKPAPDNFLRTAGLLGVEPGKCVVFEDSTNGIAGAKAAGMTCIAYSQRGRNPQDLSQADKIIDCYTKVSLEDMYGLAR